MTTQAFKESISSGEATQNKAAESNATAVSPDATTLRSPSGSSSPEVLEAALKWGWDLDTFQPQHRPDYSNDKKVMELPLAAIRRPTPRENDPAKVQVLMQSIQEVGQIEPIDVLEVDGVYWGFSGCHR
jgi:hypothetical protein